MPLPYWFETALHKTVDCFYKFKPEPFPGKEKIENCKIISHRGEHNDCGVLENTLQAFDIAKNTQSWGIEFDVRWTRDLKPVVFHDEDLERLYGKSIRISDIDLNELISNYPLIATLEEVIERYGGKLHLMVEMKKEVYPNPALQKHILKDIFSSLEPQKDYHFISLFTEMFDLIDFVPLSTFIPISEFNIKHLSRLTIHNNYGGIFGHYIFLNDTYVRRHHRMGQITGTGYINSKKCLFRELNRDIDLIFTNHAFRLQSIRNACLVDNI